MRGVRPGRGDEVPRARVTTTVGVRSELPRSRAGPGAKHTVVAGLFGACRHSFVSCIELCFFINCILCKFVYLWFIGKLYVGVRLVLGNGIVRPVR